MYKIEWNKYLSSERHRKSVEDVEGNGDLRNPFDRDLGRVTFCPALRRMHDKTQVIPLTGGDTVLTRLTHSLQVMNVAESLASNYTRTAEFCELYGDKSTDYANSISAILRTASLLHDIGNPPFGHFGEVSIQDYFKKIDKELTPTPEWIDFTQFDGNAMGLRMMTKLQYTGTLDGLNLTYATMGAYLKYPNKGEADKNGYVGNHKHGIFKTEEAIFVKIVEHCSMTTGDGKVKRHPLSFLVEAADSICYGVMDIEDGFTMGWYTFDELTSSLSEYAYSKMSEETRQKERVTSAMVEDKSGDTKFSIEKFLDTTRVWPDGTRKENRRLILDFREHLIGYLVRHTSAKFIDKLELIDAGTYSEEILDDDEFCINAALSKFTMNYIISQPRVQAEEIKGNSVITGLLDILIRYAFSDDKKYRSKVKGVISEARLECAMHENK